MTTRVAEIAGLVILWQASNVFAADIVFSGGLERVRRESLSVRLADGRLMDARLPNTASLAAGAIAAQYKLADQVRVSCKTIRSLYDADAAIHQHLEVKNLTLVRPPSPEEVARAVVSVSWRPGENLLWKQPASAPPSGDKSRLEHVRKVNLDYAAKLPNFVADETAKRYTSSFDATQSDTQWRYRDTIESDIAFNGERVSRQRIRRNGKPWGRPFPQLPGYIWAVWFGIELRPLFSPECPTTIDFEGREGAPGPPLSAYRFASPANGCFGSFSMSNSPGIRYTPARTGRFLVEDPGGHVMRFEAEAAGFPEDFEFDRSTAVETWDYVKIEESTFLLPVRAEIVSLNASGGWWRVTVEYKNHRHFEASTNVSFP